jgi:hypothetical protein
VRERIDAIEGLIQQEVGRGATALFAASRGGLWGAVSALSAAKPRYVGILTGFFVPHGDDPGRRDGRSGRRGVAGAWRCRGSACDAAC